MNKNILLVLLSFLVYAGGAFAENISAKNEKWINKRLWQPMTEQRKAALNKVLNYPSDQQREFLRKRVELFCETSPRWWEKSKNNYDNENKDRSAAKGQFALSGPMRKIEGACEKLRSPKFWEASNRYEEYLAKSRALITDLLWKSEKKEKLERALVVAFFMPTQVSGITQEELLSIDATVRAKFEAKPAAKLPEALNFDAIGTQVLEISQPTPWGKISVDLSMRELEALFSGPQSFKSDGKKYSLQIVTDDHSGLDRLLNAHRKVDVKGNNPLYLEKRTSGGQTNWLLSTLFYEHSVHIRVLIKNE